MEKNTKINILFGLGMLFDFVLIDQLTKWLLTNTETIQIIPGFARIMYLENDKIAFSLPLQGPILLMLTAFFIAVLIWAIFYYKVWEKRWPFFCMMAILAGAIGNAIDRFVRGYVIDFISIGNFPVFNVADMCVSVGVALFLAWSIFEDREKEQMQPN